MIYLNAKKKIYTFFGILCCMVFFVLPTVVMAQDAANNSTGGTGTEATPAGSSVEDEIADPASGDTSIPFFDTISGFIYTLFITIGGLIAQLGGTLLDVAINQLVVGMGEHLRGNFGVAVDSLWLIIRDVFNIFFIFGLIFLGIKTIIRSNDTNTQKAIGYLIVAALLINFSLFATKLVVDLANVTAFQIVKAMDIGGVDVGLPAEGSRFETPSVNYGVSGAFMHRLDLASFAQKPVEPAYRISFGFLMMLLMIIAGFVFLAGAFLLISRFVILVVLLIFSPMLFLGWIFPNFASISSKYWNTFLNNAFVAPAYLFMLYMSLRIFEELGSSGTSGNGSFADFGSNSGENNYFALFLFFAVMAGFLIGSVIIAQKMGAAGASQAMRISQRGQNIAKGFVTRPIGISGGLVAGGAARLGRNTVGMYAQRYAENDKNKERAKRSGFAGSFYRGMLKGSRVAADSSFDARQVAGGKVSVGGVTIDTGSGKKGGYKTRLAETKKKEGEFARSLGTVSDDDEKVQEWQKEIDDQEVKIELAKRNLKAAESEDEIAAAQKELKSAEAKLQEFKANKEREKQRRQIGSVENHQMRQLSEKGIAETEAEITRLTEEWREEKDVEKRKEIAKVIAGHQNEAKQYKKDLKKRTAEAGYVGVLQGRGLIGSAFYGRIHPQDNTAGAEIRKEYEKNIKQTKEDKNNASIIDAVKSSAKKDG